MRQDLHELAPMYALDALDPDERLEFEAHMSACEECAEEVTALREVAGRLAKTDEVTPPPGLKGQVLRQLANIPQVPLPTTQNSADVVDLDMARTRARRRMNLLLATAAAVLVVVAGSVAATQLRGPTQAETVEAASDAVSTDLIGDAGTVEVIWSQQLGKAVIRSDNLADPGPGRTYELWFLLADGDVSPAGLFLPAEGSTQTVLEVEDRPDGLGWGVTIEPAGGSRQPTGPVLFVGMS